MDRLVLLSLYAAVLAVSSAQFLGGEQAIDDFTDPGVQAAAKAAVNQLNSFRSSDLPELILYWIVSGTIQVFICKLVRKGARSRHAHLASPDSCHVQFQCL